MKVSGPPLVVHCFADSLPFAHSLATLLAAPVQCVDLHRFPDRESRVRVELPQGREAVLVRQLHDPNAKLLETLFAADALRRNGAMRVTLVAPYLPYMRQDVAFHPGEAVSQRVVGSLLASSFDRVLTLEPHLHRVSRLDAIAGRGARALSATPALAEWIEEGGRDCVVVGPDEESAPWVRRVAALADVPWVVGRKQRLSDRKVRIDFPELPKCRRAVLLDDIASSGVTLAVAARALKGRGVRFVDAVVVHAIFATGAMVRIRAAGVRRMVSCDTVPHPTNAIATAPLFLAELSKGVRA